MTGLIVLGIIVLGILAFIVFLVAGEGHQSSPRAVWR